MEKKEIEVKMILRRYLLGSYHKSQCDSRNRGLECCIERDDFIYFISDELDKAREEGKREAFTKDEWFMLKLAMNDIFNNGNTAYEEISEKIKGYLN